MRRKQKTSWCFDGTARGHLVGDGLLALAAGRVAGMYGREHLYAPIFS